MNIMYMKNNNEQIIWSLWMFQKYKSQKNSCLNLIAGTIVSSKDCLLIAVSSRNHFK